MSDTHSPVITLTDTISEDDWTNLNYWTDIGDFTSDLIGDAERMLRKLYPDGHDYNLSKVNIVNISFIGDVEE